MQTLYPTDIREEEIKLRVANDFFAQYDTTKIIGNIDFCVANSPAPQRGPQRVYSNGVFFAGRGTQGTGQDPEIDSLVWGEAKQGSSHDIYHSFVQLILTIGKARTFDKNLPPQYLAAFDAARFAFIPYHAVQDVFYQNDFNWNVTASDHKTQEFQQLYSLVEKTLHENAFVYNYVDDEKALRRFIKQNLVLGNRKTKRHKVNKNNFTFVYQRWCEEVKQSIQIDWDKAKKVGLLDADFFLADLLSKDGNYLLDNLYVLLKHDHYQFDRRLDELDLWSSKEARFKDDMQAHISFWNKYERPPKREYWGYIVERRDLLVPQDVRERKGSFFTPRQWVELSQEYLANVLGEDWQDNYYIWDCCAGTGNLLNGLTNPRNVWASTLDKADVDVMHERVRNGAQLYDNHIFQFDFLNDDFSRLPQELQEIINDPDKRKRLVIYINPPYAEASNARQRTGTGENRALLAKETLMYKKYFNEIKTAARELFAQFFIRIYHEIPGSTLAEFSTLKILQASNFADFRSVFRAKLLKAFIVPAKTFDNVKGSFPIGFFIWDTGAQANSPAPLAGRGTKGAGELATSDYTDTIGIPKGYDEGTHSSSPAENLENQPRDEREMSETTAPIPSATDALPLGYGYADMYNNKGELIGQKHLVSYDNDRLVIEWLRKYYDKQEPIGYLRMLGTDMQNNNGVFITNNLSENDIKKKLFTTITKRNVVPMSIYCMIRHVVDETWYNDRDQFCYPLPEWEQDRQFQLDLLIYCLFNNANRISLGTQGATLRDNRNQADCVPQANHWIPFTEQELGLTEGFASHFMQDYLRDFLAGKVVVTESLPSQEQRDLFSAASEAQECDATNDRNRSPLFTSADEPSALYTNDRNRSPLFTQYSPEAQGVMDAGREVYRYYHQTRKQKGGGSLNASLYDIKFYFKGETNGKMNATSGDDHFNALMENLRLALQALAKRIEPKVYEYGFLK